MSTGEQLTDCPDSPTEAAASVADVPVGQAGYEYRQLKFYKEEVVTVLYIFVSVLKGTIALYDFLV